MNIVYQDNYRYPHATLLYDLACQHARRILRQVLQFIRHARELLPKQTPFKVCLEELSTKEASVAGARASCMRWLYPSANLYSQLQL